jgi:hypothetical protein
MGNVSGSSGAGAGALGEALAALQTDLCSDQCFFWQAGLQYVTDEHPLHLSFPASSQSGLLHRIVIVEAEAIIVIDLILFE